MKYSFFYLGLLILLLSACSDEDSRFSGNSPSPSLESDSNGINNNGNGSVANETAGESYNDIIENPFIKTIDETVSTFSIDADGASYSNTRRFVASGTIPPIGAIRTEELINYFNYDYAEPRNGNPISLEGEVSSCPWNTAHKLVRIGLKGEHIKKADYPTSNIVFLIDVSGSMGQDNKLGLLKEGIKLFVDQIRPEDRIAIVTYASNPSVLLQSSAGSEKNRIKEAIDALGAGGSTNGEGGGILSAYEIATDNFIEGGNNRIIVGTDGDFNVGISNQEDLISLIEVEREKGVYLTVLGVGTGNLQEGMMEQLANNGNGNFEYLDNLDQAKKVFINEYNKFFAVAKDVKVQINFNPENVKEYRLIGYENRLLADEDFEDDTKDAGEIGADQSITALYEIIPVIDVNKNLPAFEIDFRYKLPHEDISQPMALAVYDNNTAFHQASDNHQFASSVASFGLKIRESEYQGEVSYGDIVRWADRSKSFDPYGYKEAFIGLVESASRL